MLEVIGVIVAMLTLALGVFLEWDRIRSRFRGSTAGPEPTPASDASRRALGAEPRDVVPTRRFLPPGWAMAIAALIALPLLGVIAMAVFDLCPPPGPWPLPPWCPGSQFTWPF